MADLSVDAQPRYARTRQLILRYAPPGCDLIELGAAPGDQIAALAAIGYRATALDIGIASDTWANGEQGRMLTLFARSDIRFIEWNLEHVPYPVEDSAFDAVLMTEVYEHLRDYPVRSLLESWRILRPGGHLFFTTPNAASLAMRLRLLRGRSSATPLADWIDGLPHARHAREYTFDEVRRLMHHAGFQVVYSESRHFHLAGGSTPKRVAKRVIDILARLRPTLGPQIVVVAQKPPSGGDFPFRPAP